ncbi:MAG: hypothetical protein AAF718_04070 [Pseudomonadota bacterium]
MPELGDETKPKVPTKTDDRLRKRLREALSYAAAVAALAGILLGTFEYFQRKDQVRARHTMDQIEYWDDHGIRAAYRSLSGRVAEVLAIVPDRELAAASDDPELARKLKARVAERVLQYDDAPEQFDDVIYFFSRLSLCIEARVCDGDAAAVFFEDTLDSFLDTFEGEVRNRSERIESYGAAVLSLADRFDKT